MKPKLLLITDNYPYTRGELPFLLPELEQTAPLFDIHIVCLNETEDFPQYQAPFGIPVTHYKPSYTKGDILKNAAACLADAGYRRELNACRKGGGLFRVRESEVRNFRLAAVKLHRFLQTKGFFDDAAHTLYYSYWNHWAALALLLEKKRRPEMTIVTRAHGYDLYHERRQGGYQPYKRQMDPGLNRVYFVSQNGLDYYKEHFATGGAEKYRLSRLGVKDNGLNPSVESKELRLFSCSNLVEVKRVHLIIEALALLKERPVRWTHAGGGPLEAALQAKAAALLGPKDNITYEFLGGQSNEAVLDFYRTQPMDLFVSTTQSEGGTPVSMMEALSFGVPVLSTAVGGVPEIIDEQVGALLPADCTPLQIAEELVRFAQMGTQQRQLMQERARLRWKQDFQAEKNHAAFAQMLLAEGKR